MKKLTNIIIGASIIALLALFAVGARAQTNTPSGIGQTVKNFFANNPTNTWDVSGYGLASRSDHFGYGAGTRFGYWLTPSVGAALDFNYCDSSWTFTSLGLAGRGTINVGPLGSVSPYASIGAGWNIRGGTVPGSYNQSVVAVAGGGATIHIAAIKWFDFVGEYQHLTMNPNQDRILFGITRRF
jgi:hypothetical protein